MLSLAVYLLFSGLSFLTAAAPIAAITYLLDAYKVPDACGVPIMIYVVVTSLISGGMLFVRGLKIADSVSDFEYFLQEQKRKRVGR